MKKFMLIVCISLIGCYLSGQDLATLKINKIDSKSLSKGDSVTVRIELDKTSFVISSIQLYMQYDSSVLKYQGTTYIHDQFARSWKENSLAGLYAGFYTDAGQNGFEVLENIIVCELEFTYLGGATYLSFGTEEDRYNEVPINGETRIINLLNDTLPLDLIDGCVCDID